MHFLKHKITRLSRLNVDSLCSGHSDIPEKQASSSLLLTGRKRRDHSHRELEVTHDHMASPSPVNITPRPLTVIQLTGKGGTTIVTEHT